MIDLISLRRENLSKILRQLHFQGAQNRSSLSQELGIRLNSMNSLMEELKALKLICQVDEHRPRSPFRMETEKNWIMSVIAGQEGVTLAILNFQGEVVEERRHAQVPSSLLEMSELMTEHLSLFTDRMDRSPWGCGVAFSGIVDQGVVKRSVVFNSWVNINLSDHWSQELGLMTLVDNDTHCAARSQPWFVRRGESNKSSFMLALGRGISSAMVFDGHLFQGAKGSSGEIGHIPIAKNGRLCICGRTDCLESYCGTKALLADVNEVLNLAVPLSDVEDVVTWYHRHPNVGNIINRLAENLCVALIPIVAALDVDELLLVSEDPRFSDIVCEALNRHFSTSLVGHMAHGIQWVSAGALRESQLQGAGAMILERVLVTAGGQV